jgi:RNA polymerase sigma-70 factor (ECF subfamily)
MPTTLKHLSALVVRAQKGDTEAFGKVYELLLEDVFRYIYFRVGSNDAGDLAEDTFVRAWEKLHTYTEQKHGSFRSWVFTIAHNIVVDYYRKGRVIVPLDVLGPIAQEDITSNPDFHVNSLLSVDLIARAIQSLKEDAQQVIILKYINELSYAEIAASMQKSETAIRIIAHRALKELKRMIEKMYPSGH